MKPQDANAAETSRRTRRDAALIRDLILEAARSEFGVAGYAGATTAAIARKAQVTEAQLFRQFRSKAEIFHEAIFAPLDRRFEEFNRRQLDGADVTTGDRREQTRRYVRELIGFIEQNREMIAPLVVAQFYGAGRIDGLGAVGGLQSYFDIGAARIASRVNASDVPGDRDDIDPQWLVRTSFGAVLAAVLFRDWIFPATLDEDAFASAVGNFVLDGISLRS